ncbi:MAG: hypothetical protein KAV82_06290 [Phycisphaerae bacterium]|nr:hypothetical protein [Phycisphaerae bacterium]
MAMSLLMSLALVLPAAGNRPISMVWIDPDPAVAGQEVVIHYDPSAGPLLGSQYVFLHWGINNWDEVFEPDPVMVWNSVYQAWEVGVSVPGNATQLDVAFHDSLDVWDNNDGADWHFEVEPGTPEEWVMDGVLDAGATLLASNGGMVLYAGVIGEVLYVATWDAGEGSDHFIFLADTPGALRAAPWSKAGQVADWTAYLAQENDSLWSNWFDAAGTTASASGTGDGYLEGTINLVEEFGSMPANVYLAVALYGNDDDGVLLFDYQVPASVNSDGNLDADECLQVNICELLGEYDEADLDRNCVVDLADFALFEVCLNGPSQSSTCPPDVDADYNDDGDVDLQDFAAFQAAFAD